MPKKDKKADRIRDIYNKTKTHSRAQWEYINQKGYDFSNDNQLTEEERISLESQGMPTFTINRIMPVVEMLNFYATAQSPRWQAVGAEGSDVDAAAVFSDLADYIWHQSDGSCRYANAINDSITKSIGYLMVTVDQDADHGMGEVKIEQPDPFDVFVDPKARDIMFKDAAYILIRKLLPKHHLMKIYPQFKTKIKNASGDRQREDYYSEKSGGPLKKDFHYKDVTETEAIDPDSGDHDDIIEFYEFYEKIKVAYMNVFYRIPPDKETIAQIQQQVEVRMMEMKKEMDVELLEQQAAMQEAVQKGEMLPERFKLEMEKAQKMQAQQLEVAKQEYMSQLQSEMSKIENVIVSEKEFNAMMKNKQFQESLVDNVKFYGNRIKLTCVAGDKTLYEKVLPDKVKEYPIVPFHFKWTGTPFPISAVSPLIGKQMELNKAHQIMVHNASLGSSLRWMHEEGSVDTDYWEQYASSPGALLPIRPGATPPTPVQPAPLSNAFFSIVQEGKGDMEYLAGIYGAMQGDVGSQHETYRGMLAMDEYGTRRVKQWMKNSVETALMHLGEVVMQFSQAVYTAHKVFRIVQPSALQEEREVEFNVPMYNDYGQVIGKFKDYNTAKFDIRIIAGSTLPVNRWAYLDELKQLMQLGVIDDIALLAETDIRNKEKIAKRKSLYSQLQGQVSSMEEELKDREGTIETLERQLVQAGIKNKVMQATVEINKKKEEVKGDLESEAVKGSAAMDVIKGQAKNNVAAQNTQANMMINEVEREAKAQQKENLTEE
tara:strand:- start:909 stop:3221 length:2313 start_codon:yes stop_codon:yes gene_type:complete